VDLELPSKQPIAHPSGTAWGVAEGERSASAVGHRLSVDDRRRHAVNDPVRGALCAVALFSVS
jgi:hypothetical protein